MADGQQGDARLDIFDAEATAQIRHVWHNGRWFFNVIDAIGLLTDSLKTRQYWFDMKRHVEGESFANCQIFPTVENVDIQRSHNTSPAIAKQAPLFPCSPRRPSKRGVCNVRDRSTPLS